MRVPPGTRGVVTMSDDSYLFWFANFLESFRRQNPNLPLYCIPYHGRATKVRQLRRLYAFEMLEPPEIADVDDLAVSLYGDHPRRFLLRRYVALAQAFDEVLFIDADTAVLSDLASLFGRLREGTDLIYGTTSEREVYNESYVARYPDSRLFCAAMFLTSPACMPFAEFLSFARDNRDLLLAARYPGAFDQPLLNLFVDETGRAARHYDELQNDSVAMVFSGYDGIRWKDGRVSLTGNDRRVLSLHWSTMRHDLRNLPFTELLMELTIATRKRLRAAGLEDLLGLEMGAAEARSG